MSVSFLLVTANVGSLFDENDSIEPFWESAFFELIEKTSPDFLALHLQEIGGKEYEKHMRKVSQFIEKLYRNISARFHLYDGFSFADEDVQTADKFTALGCLYLVNRSIGDHLHVWNFHTSVYEKVSGFILFDHCDKARFVRRIKFPIHLFPNFKWTRKGYTKTRWKLFGKELQLVNIHLFHDACNLTAMQESPSVYSNSRREAFNHALAELRSENFNNHAGFIFGDFNFRLDGKELLRRLATGADSTELVNSTNGQTLSLCRRIADTEEELLTIGTKKFDHLNGNHLSHELLEQFNKEARQFPQLFECEIKFAPSYPYCEDVALPTTLMKTRAPAWCDRVLMNSIAWDLISKSSDVQYDSTGLTVCTGDHKPVYLHFSSPISLWQTIDSPTQSQNFGND